MVPKLPRPSRRQLRLPPRLELLESRLAPAGLQPTVQEQLLLLQLNAIRANPAAYGQSIGLNLSNVAPAPPLAFNPLIEQAAHDHSQDMNDNNYFSHINLQGQDPGQRLSAVGFNWSSYSESIAGGYPTSAAALQALIIDQGVPTFDHRVQLLALDANALSENQVGVGVVTGSGSFSPYYTIDTAQAQGDGNGFVTGVVYNDVNKNNQYDAGEGLGGVTVTANNGNSTTTFATGGYSLELAPGNYTLTFTGGALVGTVTRSVTIGTRNVEVDVTQPTGPVLAPVPNQTVSHTQHSLQVTLNGSDLTGLILTYSATVAADNPAFDLRQQFHFAGGGYVTAGATAYVLTAARNNAFGNPYYLLSPQGQVYAYDGSGSYAHTFANVAPLARLGAAVYDNPALLLGAQPPSGPAPAVGVSVNGNVLTLTPPGGFLGAFRVTASAGDGVSSTQQSFAVNVIDNAPVPAPVANQTLSHTQFPLQLALGAGDADGDPVSFTAQVTGYSPAYALEQQYLFQGFGYVTAGATAYVLKSAQPGPGVNGYYLLRPDGALFAYDGSASYATTFANGTPLGQLGAATYANPALLLNAPPPENYAALSQLMAQYQFTPGGYATAGAPAYVLKSGQAGAAVGGYYLLRPDGAIYAYDGSASFAATFANRAPLATLDPSVYVNPSLLLSATTPAAVSGQAYLLSQQYQFQGFGYMTAGATAYVLHSSRPGLGVNGYYLLRSDGALFAYDGATSYATTFANGTPLAQLGAAVYANPALLLNANTPVAPAGLTASVSGNTLTVGSTARFAGTFQVAVTASDGILSTTETFLVTSTDNPPQLQSVANLTSAHGSPVRVTLSDGDPDGDPVALSAQVTGYSLSYALEQQYGFAPGGYVTAGAPAFVLVAGANNGFGNPFYLLSASGGLYAYDGSGSYAHTFANVTPVAQLGAATYSNPSWLFNAAPPVTPAVGVSFSGNVLTLTPPSGFVGTLKVTVTASDGMLATSQSFLATLT